MIPRKELSPEARSELEAVYREVDETIRSTGVECWLRGKCCNFEIADHTLFSSSVELAYVREKHPDPFPADSVLCPFWRDGLCVERDRRPLGCRTYFCDEKYRDETQAVYEKYHRRISEIAEKHGVEYRYEPFVDALRQARDGD